MKRAVVVLTILLLSAFLIHAQEENNKRHSLGVMISHATVLTEIAIDGEQRIFWVPTWGILYDFEVSERFALGIHADIFLQSFKIEEKDGEIITRDYPIAVAMVGNYNIFNRLWLSLGGGIELERERNLGLVTVGLEYVVPIQEQWKLTPSLSFDAKIDGYQNWILGLAVARRF
jgi:hypothetical protein